MKNMALWNDVCVTDPQAVKPITGKPGCILWDKAKTPAGYGVTYKNGKNVYAHRVAAERAFGEIPEGMMVGHKCDTPCCVNPDHLFICTHAENMADMRNKNRSARGERHKSRTRPDSVARGEGVGTSKLTAKKVEEIRAAYATGKSGVKRENSLMSLAKLYEVSYTAIHKIVNRKMWV